MLRGLQSVPLRPKNRVQNDSRSRCYPNGRQLADQGTQEAVVTPIKIHEPVRSVGWIGTLDSQRTQREWAVHLTVLETEPLVDLLRAICTDSSRAGSSMP
jgi:hypothetical protein